MQAERHPRMILLLTDVENRGDLWSVVCSLWLLTVLITTDYKPQTTDILSIFAP